MEPSTSKSPLPNGLGATAVFNSRSPTPGQNSPNLSPETKLLASSTTPTSTFGASSPNRGLHNGTTVTDDSGNFSEVTDLADSPVGSSKAMNSRNGSGNGANSEKPVFAIGSPCLNIRPPITALLNNSQPQNIDKVTPVTSSQDMLGPPSSSESPGVFAGLSLPSIKLNTNKNPHAGDNVCRSDSYLGLLAENFHAFYQQKLLDIEKEAGGDQEAYVQKRNSVLRDWINDLVEQNQVLIETVDEMEREAAAKIMHLDDKVFQSSQMAVKHMSIIQEYEQQVQHLLSQRATFEEEARELRSDSTMVRNKNAKLEETLNVLESENEKLVTLITRIRDWGVWDISDLHLSQRTYYRIFELYPNLAGSEVQTVFTRERAREVQETENQLDELKTTLEDLQNFKFNAEKSLNEKNNMLTDLQNDREELREKLRMYVDENAEYKRSLQETQNLLAAMSLRSTMSTPRTTSSNQNSDVTTRERDHEITEMLKELRDLRSQLSVACTERQNAVMEASSLKHEMNEHLDEVQHMKNLLINIQNDAQNTKSKVQDVQDKQDQLSSLRDQVHTYQMKYDEARDMLNIKSDTIQNLQRQMDLLHEKVVKIENEKSRTRTPVPPTPQNARKSKSKRDLRSQSPGIEKRSSNSKFDRPTDNKFDAENSHSRQKRSRPAVKKPPWNEHFIKGSLEEQDVISISVPDDTPTRRYETYNHSPLVPKSSLILARERQERRRQEAMRHDYLENHRKRNTQLLENRKSAAAAAAAAASKQRESFNPHPGHAQKYDKETPYDTVSLKPSRISTNSAECSGKAFSSPAGSAGYQKVAQYFSDRFGITLEGNKGRTNFPDLNSNLLPTPERVKLPPIDRPSHGHGDRITESRDSKKLKAERKFVQENQYHLPRLVKRQNNTDKEKERNEYAASGHKTLDALVTEAVRASKEMIESFDPSKGNLSMRVRASHRHHHRRVEETPQEQPQHRRHRHQRESEKAYSHARAHATRSRSYEVIERDIPITTLFRADRLDKTLEVVKDVRRRGHSHGHSQSHEQNKRAVSETDPSFTVLRQKQKGQQGSQQQSRPTTANGILAALPAESQEYLVQSWIRNSSNTSTLPDDLSEDNVEVETDEREINVNNVNYSVKQKQQEASVNSRYGLTKTGIGAGRSQSQKNSVKSTEKQSVAHASGKTYVVHHEPSKSMPNGHLPNKAPGKYVTVPEDDPRYFSSHNGPLNNNTEPPPGHNYLVNSADPSADRSQLSDIQCQALQERISMLESQCATKDTLLSSLHCELEAEKLDKTNYVKAMDSKDAEITMQKGRSHNGLEEQKSSGTGSGDAGPLKDSLLRSYNEILKHEEVMTGLKSESDSLSLRTELLEKNVLLYKSYVILGAIEPDYDYSCGDYSPMTDVKDGRFADLDCFLPQQISDLRASQRENQELKARLDSELVNIRVLQQELDVLAANKFAEMSLTAKELEECIGHLKTENVQLKLELKNVTENVTARKSNIENKQKSGLVNEIEKCIVDLAEKDEQIRIRNQQISQYEEYVQKLHEELKAWAKKPEYSPPPIPANQFLQKSQGLEQDGSQSQRETQSNMTAEIEKLKRCLEASERRETELRCDNQMLKQTVSTLSVKIEEWVKCFEFMQFEETQQDHSQSLNSIPIPTDYGVPLLTSTPSKVRQHWGHRERSGEDNEYPGTPTSVATPRLGNIAPSPGYFEANSPAGQPGTSYASLMNSTRDKNNSYENRLGHVEQLIEQLKAYVDRSSN